MTTATTTEAKLTKRAAGLRTTCLAATVMVLVQIGLGYWISASVDVPAGDSGGGVFMAIGRVLSRPPITLAIHAGLGLILIITAISATVRAYLARRVVAIGLAVIALAAILVANLTGALFVDTGEETNSTIMLVASGVALVSYLFCLALAGSRSGTR